MIFTQIYIWPDSRRRFMPRRMFTPPPTLPDDPATLQLILRAAAGRDRTAATAARRTAPQSVRSPLGTTRRRHIATRRAKISSNPWPNNKPGSTRPCHRRTRHRRNPTPLPTKHRGTSRRSATAARCRRICRGSRSSWTSTTRPVPVVAARCMSSAKTGPRCWIMSRLSCACG